MDSTWLLRLPVSGSGPRLALPLPPTAGAPIASLQLVGTWYDEESGGGRVERAPRRYVAYFTKGLGDIVAAELREIVPDAQIEGQTEKHFFIALDWAELARLRASTRTVDDLRVLVAAPTTVQDENCFAQVCAEAAAATRAFLEHDDPARLSQQTWSVTMSARNPAWRNRPTWEPGPAIAKHLRRADLAAASRQAVDVRIQADGDTLHMSANLPPGPLASRSTPLARAGALRPTVAAAMLLLATTTADDAALRHGLYDPFCGTGTIVVEAAQQGLPVYASDVDSSAVDMTRARLAALSRRATGAEGDLLHRVFVHDLLRGIPQRVNAAVIVANLPWGKQVKVDRRGDLFDVTGELAAHAVAGGGCAVLLKPHTRSNSSPASGNMRRTPKSRLSESACSDRPRASSWSGALVSDLALG